MDNVDRLKSGALLIIGFFMLLWVVVIAFGVGEAVGNHAYAWLILVPVGLWGLRVQVIGFRKVSQAAPDDPRWPASGREPSEPS